MGLPSKLTGSSGSGAPVASVNDRLFKYSSNHSKDVESKLEIGNIISTRGLSKLASAPIPSNLLGSLSFLLTITLKIPL